MRELDCTEEYIQEWAEDARGDHTVQICIICETTMRFLFFSLRDLSKYRSIDKESSRKLSETWAEVLQSLIETGDTSNMARLDLGLVRSILFTRKGEMLMMISSDLVVVVQDSIRFGYSPGNCSFFLVLPCCVTLLVVHHPLHLNTNLLVRYVTHCFKCGPSQPGQRRMWE